MLVYGDSQAFLCSTRDNTRWEQSAADSPTSLFKGKDLKRVENSCQIYIPVFIIPKSKSKNIFSKANQLLRMWFSSAAEHQVPLTVLVSLKTSFHSQPMDNSSLRRQHTRGYLYAWYQIQGDTESTQTPVKGSEWKDTNSLQSIITETSCWWHRAVTLVFRFTTHALCGFQNRYRP